MSGCVSTTKPMHDFCYVVQTPAYTTKHDRETISDGLHKWVDGINAIWEKLCK